MDNAYFRQKETIVEPHADFITVKPANDLVSQYIGYYYFHKSGDDDFSQRFFFYPNYKHAITVYRGSDVALTNEGSTVTPASHRDVRSLYSINTDRNFKVSLNGRFEKMGIVFNPLGLNHFIAAPLSDVYERETWDFDYFGDDFTTLSHKVFDEPDPARKAALLDAFFSEKYCGFNEPVVKKAMQELLVTNGSARVEELSEELQVNRKTLFRLFRKHLCCSVVEYKKLVMFRNALNYAQQAGVDASLTDVALYSLYYDQAHYIKHFKQITRQSPKALLSKLTSLGNQQTYWHFEE